MKKRTISFLLIAVLSGSMFLSGCGDSRVGETTATEDTGKVAAVTADSEDRPGAKWIDSGLYGTFEGMGDIRPQDDFAAYVNREWAENVKISDGEPNASARTEQSERLDEEKIKLISGEKKDDEVLTSLQNFYQLLLDWDSRNKSGVEPLKPYVTDIMGISSLEEYTEFLSDPKRNLLESPMVENTVLINEEDAFSNILVIESSKRMGYGSEIYDGADKGEENEIIQAYRQIVEHVLGQLGYSEAEAKEIFDRGLSFELKFVSAMREYEEARAKKGVASTTNLYTVKETKEQFGNFPLCEIYKSLGYDLKDGPIRIMYPAMIKQFDKLYTQDNIEELKAWTLIHMIGENADYLDRETYEIWNKAQMAVAGNDTLPKDETYAMKVLSDKVPMMMDQAYVKYCFDKEIKPQVAELTDMIIDAYRDMLKEEDWLSDQTKEVAIEKLDHIKHNICYPDKLPDVEPLLVKSADENETLFEAIKAARRYITKTQSDRILRKNDGTYWADDIYYSTLGASYEVSQNSINIHAGICGGDFYDPDWPLEKKLGGLCMVVGHEISHAFDSHGANFDKDGNHKNWWTEEDKDRFQKRVDKLIAYYSKLVPVPQLSEKPYGEGGALRVNGEATSDLASLKCLLSIAKKQKDFDYEMFFTQLAIIQKNARYAPAEKISVATESHPVECYRCNIPVQNYDEFLETFHVKEGDGMYLAPEDRIRVW